LDLKAALELSLAEIDAARVTVNGSCKHADSPTAGVPSAVVGRQAAGQACAIVAAGAEVSITICAALRAISIVVALLATGHVVAAQAHLWLHAAIAPEEDTRSRELLVGLNHYSGLPLILRDQLHFRPWPENAPWAKEAQQAAQLADHGRWQQAVAIIDRLGQQYGADPTLVYNRALAGGWLADERALTAGLHAFAGMDVPLDDAIEAEAVAQLLDPDRREEQFDSVVETYDINDLDALAARFAADPRIESFQVDPASLPSDQPRPRHTYIVLDKPMPATGANLSRADVPRLAGVMAIYGRQTDRRELELTIDKGPDFRNDGCRAGNCRRRVGMFDGVVGRVSSTEQALNWRWHFPRDTPPDVRRRLVAEERQASIVERWPDVRRPALGGKTAREAAGVPELRIPLMAAVLILEQGGKNDRNVDAIAELRRTLGLPEPAPIEGSGPDVAGLPLVRVPRLKIEDVSDDALVQLYRRSLLVGADAAVARIAQEAVRRRR
jgi:hypothetical protein